MTTSSLRRQVKNIVHNYTEAEVKVREATSNDPWGPSGELMSEIADLTYSMPAFAEVMGIIWKRLSDHGRNWRHVHKALVLLEYLIRAGSERVVHHCRQNMFAIQVLREFQYVDRDGRDHGSNVREKARQLIAFVRDEERVQRERTEALSARSHVMAAAVGIGNRDFPPPYPGIYSPQPSESTIYRDEFAHSRVPPSSAHSVSSPSRVSSALEHARPQSTGEEELQLQVALAVSREESEKPHPPVDDDEEAQLELALRLSKESEEPAPDPPIALDIDEETQLQIALSLSEAEHQQEQRSRQGDESLLQKALEESKRELQAGGGDYSSSFMEQNDIFGPVPANAPSDPWDLRTLNTQSTGQPRSDPWDILETRSSSPVIPKPWVPPPAYDSFGQSFGPTLTLPEPWEAPKSPDGAFHDHTGSSSVDPFSALSEDIPSSNPHPKVSCSGSPTDGDLFGEPVKDEKQDNHAGSKKEPFDLSQLGEDLPKPPPQTSCNPEAFLGPAGASLVDLDNLIPSSSQGTAKNPFLTGLRDSSPTNPFHSDAPRQTLAELPPGFGVVQPPAVLLPAGPHGLPLGMPPPYTQAPVYPPAHGLLDVSLGHAQPLLRFPAPLPEGDQNQRQSQNQNPFL